MARKYNHTPYFPISEESVWLDGDDIIWEKHRIEENRQRKKYDKRQKKHSSHKSTKPTGGKIFIDEAEIYTERWRDVNEKKEIRRELIKRRAELRDARKAFDSALKTNDFVRIDHAQERLDAALEGLSELRDDAQDDIGITQMRRSSNMGESIADRIVKTAGAERLIKRYQK